MATSTCHVVAATVLLDLHMAPRTLFQCSREIFARGIALVCGPLVFANEAHHCVKAKISQSNTIAKWAVYLQSRRVELIFLELLTTLKFLSQVASSAGEQDSYAVIDLRCAVRAEAAEHQAALGDAGWKLSVDPALPALLAGEVHALVTPRDQGANIIGTDRAGPSTPQYRHVLVLCLQAVIALVDL